jgi:hypothetical protein
VCFIKLASRPTANVTFHSCNTSFAVDLAGITPKPMFANQQTQLFSTVFHVWGKLNRTFDRNPQGENLLDYFDQYVKWENPARPNFLQVYMESPGLINGYYNVSAWLLLLLCDRIASHYLMHSAQACVCRISGKYETDLRCGSCRHFTLGC